MFAAKRLFFGLLALVIASLSCHACTLSAVDFNDVASRTVNASVVFEGTILSTVEVSNPGLSRTASRITAAKVRVEKLIKGDLPKDFDSVDRSVVVGSRPDCRLNLKPRRRYLVFLSSNSDVIDDVTVHWLSGRPEEYSKRAAKTAHAHSSGDEKKPVAILTPKKLLPQERSNVTLKCQANGKPLPQITWYKNDQLLNNSDHVAIQRLKKQSVLMLKMVDATDGGNYWCQAANVLGTFNSSKVTLSVRRGDVLCPEQTYCLNGGTCILFNQMKSCKCLPRFTGPRCQNVGDDQAVHNKNNVEKVSSDRALASLTILLLFLIFVILLALLYCLTRFRREYNARQKLDEDISSKGNDLQPPHHSCLNPHRNYLFVPPTINDNKPQNAIAIVHRQRLSGTSSISETRLTSLPAATQQNHKTKEDPKKRPSSVFSSDQVLLLADDETDGQRVKVTNKMKKSPEEALVSCHQPIHKREVKSSSDSTAITRPLSSYSNYENQRPHVVQDVAERPWHKSVVTNMADKGYHSSSLSSAETDSQKNEEVNNLLKELGIYTPEVICEG